MGTGLLTAVVLAITMPPLVVASPPRVRYQIDDMVLPNPITIWESTENHRKGQYETQRQLAECEQAIRQAQRALNWPQRESLVDFLQGEASRLESILVYHE
ncbi:MAG: hypothetical protein ACRCZF_12015, partial [Gemmataceae bacterium]